MSGKPQLEVFEGFGDRVAALLRRHPSIGTAKALAVSAGLSRQTLHRAMNEDTMTRETARAVASALQEELSVLLGESLRVREQPSSYTIAPALPQALRRMVHDFMGEAHRTGATVEDMDYLRLSLDDESIRMLLGDAAMDRPLSAQEQVDEMEIRLDELRAWLKRRIEIRNRGARGR